MNCRNLWLWRKAVCFGLAKNQEKRVSAAHGRFGGIVKLRVGVTVFPQLVHTLSRARPQIIESPEHDRFSRANFRARRCEAALLSIVAERAFECAAGIGQRLRSPVDYSERTRDNAVATTIANIILDQDGADFGPNNCACGTCFKTTSFLAVLANIGEENPAKRIFSVATHQRMRADNLAPFLSVLLDKHHVTPRGRAKMAGVIVGIARPNEAVIGHLVPFFARDFASLAADAHSWIGKETNLNMIAHE